MRKNIPPGTCRQNISELLYVVVVVGGGVLTMLCDIAAKSLQAIEGDDIPYFDTPMLTFVSEN